MGIYLPIQPSFLCLHRLAHRRCFSQVSCFSLERGLSLLSANVYVTECSNVQSTLDSNFIKQTPIDDCWPSSSKWNALNTSVDGQLIYNQPIAKPCYPGLGYNAQLCQDISKEWTESPFQELSPIGYTYPLVNTCPPVNASVAAYPLCDLGNAPVYTINATKANDVATGVRFAKENNVRLVIKNTGHDIVGR